MGQSPWGHKELDKIEQLKSNNSQFSRGTMIRKYIQNEKKKKNQIATYFKAQHEGTYSQSILKSTAALRGTAGSYRKAIKRNTHVRCLPAHQLISHKGQVVSGH